MSYSICDINGKEIPSQIVKKDYYTNQILFIASGIPSLGYKTFILKKEKPSLQNSKLHVSADKLENQFFTVIIDTSTGWVKNILDKRNGKRII